MSKPNERKIKRHVEAARRSELKKQAKELKGLDTTVIEYLKVLDTSPDVAPHSKRDQYWADTTVKLVVNRFFDKVRKPKNLNPLDPESVRKTFRLRGVQFGNWLDQEDRVNYLLATAVSLYDLKQLLGLSFEHVGFGGKLTMALGARGRPNAVAHFEPGTFAINLNRYPDVFTDLYREKHKSTGENKYAFMLQLGGIGALAHEWAHALDLHVGKTLAASGGRSIRYRPDERQMKLDNAMGSVERILAALCTDGKGGASAFYRRLQEIRDKNNSLGAYFLYRTEILSRAFEAYLALLLKKKGLKNTFISKAKYKSIVYPKHNELMKAKPYFDELFKYYRQMKF